MKEKDFYGVVSAIAQFIEKADMAENETELAPKDTESPWYAEENKYDRKLAKSERMNQA